MLGGEACVFWGKRKKRKNSLKMYCFQSHLETTFLGTTSMDEEDEE